MLKYFVSDILTPTAHNVEWGRTGFGRKLWASKRSFLHWCGMKIGDGTSIGAGLRWLPGWERYITIGEHVAMGANCHVWAYNELCIESFCMVSQDVVFSNGGHQLGDLTPFSSRLIIREGCWIGVGAHIVSAKEEDLTIGRNAVVAAGALVVSNVPENAVVVGSPAKVVRYREVETSVWHYSGRRYDALSSPMRFVD